MTDFTPDPSDFLVDELSLPEQWQAQASLYWRYACHQADCQKAFERAKVELEVEDASLRLEITADPKGHNLTKTTNDAISAAIDVHPRHKKAVKAVVLARHALDVAKAAVSALDHKKRALQDLVALHLSNWYSEPRARSEDEREAVQSRRQFGRVREDSEDE